MRLTYKNTFHLNEQNWKAISYTPVFHVAMIFLNITIFYVIAHNYSKLKMQIAVALELTYRQEQAINTRL